MSTRQACSASPRGTRLIVATVSTILADGHRTRSSNRRWSESGAHHAARSSAIRPDRGGRRLGRLGTRTHEHEGAGIEQVDQTHQARKIDATATGATGAREPPTPPARAPTPRPNEASRALHDRLATTGVFPRTPARAKTPSRSRTLRILPKRLDLSSRTHGPERRDLAGPVKFAGFAADNSWGYSGDVVSLKAGRPDDGADLVEPMDDRGRRKTIGHRSFRQVVVVLALWTGASGCLGPKAVRYTRLRYNEVVRDTNDEQLLMNIVRLRYADSPVFIDLPSITSQFEMAGQGNYLGGYGNQEPGRTSLGFGELSLRDTPTLSYHPREGREIAKALLTPLSADLFIVVNAGANIEQLLLLTINDINDVPNAPRATTLTPQVPDDNRRSSGASSSSRRCAIATPRNWRSGRTRRPMAPPTRSPRARSKGATS